MRVGVLEKLRNQLGCDEKGFANLIDLELDDYKLLCKNPTMLPAQTILKVKKLMLIEEQKNLQDYSNKFSNTPQPIFTSNKVFAHFDKLSEYCAEDRRRNVGPITVEFHPSTYCNHACPGCTFGTGSLDKSKKCNFDIDLLNQLQQDLKTLGVKGINISGGGEPLCHPKWKTIIDSFNFAGFSVGLVTNGELLTDPQVVLDNCEWIRFSVDAGSEEVYKEMHGNCANFEKTLNNIKDAVYYKKQNGSACTIGVSFLLTPFNYLDVLPAINMFKKIGVDYVQIKPIMLLPEDRVNLTFIFWEKEIFELLSNVSTYSTEIFKVYPVTYKFAELIKYEKTGVPFKKCYGHALFPCIASNGVVVACCLKLNDYNAGSMEGYYGQITKQTTFSDIWQSDYRYDQGERICTRNCQINCKIAETNKVLMELANNKIQHKNFLN